MSNPFKRFRQLDQNSYDDHFFETFGAQPRREETGSPEKPRDVKSIEKQYRQNEHFERQ